MNTTLLFIGFGILTILVILVGLCGLLLLKRIQTTRKRTKIEAYIEKTQTDWYKYLIEGTIEAEALAPSNKIEIEAADEVLYRYRKSFNSKLIHAQTIHYTELYLEPFYRKTINSQKWSTRMNALQRIFIFQLQFMIDEVVDIAKEHRTDSKEEMLLVYKIIAMMKPTKFIPYFMNPTLCLGEFDYRRLLTPLSEEQLRLVAKQFDDLPTVIKYVLVDVIGDKYFINFLPLLENCITSDDVELRIRALKAIARIDTFPETDVAKKFVTSPIWEERLMAAKLYANAPLEIAHVTLTDLLTDTVYQVRKQAALSLKTIRTGDQALQAFIQQSTDGFAIEMATEMIGKE